MIFLMIIYSHDGGRDQRIDLGFNKLFYILNLVFFL